MSALTDKTARKPRTRSSWNWIGFALSATIVGISVFVLANILKDVDFGRVVSHVRAMPASQVGWAVLFVAGAYATLTGYDFFAVRTIGANHVPYRIAALASFASYAIGHNIGATAVSGGAVRYRIYSQFGLGVIDEIQVLENRIRSSLIPAISKPHLGRDRRHKMLRDKPAQLPSVFQMLD